MRLLALLAVGLFAGTLTAADDKKDEKKVKDEEAIVGKWQVEKLDTGDPSAKQPPAEELAKVTMTFHKGGKMVMTLPSNDLEYEYKLDPTAKPKALDLTLNVKKGGQLSKLVYELDGDTLKVCGVGDQPRPTEVKAEKGKYAVTVLKRVKDEKKDK